MRLVNRHLSAATLSLCALILLGCGVLGKSDIEVAPYTILEQDERFEIRRYDRLVLVSASMPRQQDRGGLFRKLFAYISGNNQQSQKIAMTAPVFMGSPESSQQTMSFVLPEEFSLESAPSPHDGGVSLRELKNYTVAVIRFSGHLEQSNIRQHRTLLEQWIEKKHLSMTGEVNVAGYNPPYTLPALRRNEVMIPVDANVLNE